jgi:hypothetical protein
MMFAHHVPRTSRMTPTGTAGLRHFTIRFDSADRLHDALHRLPPTSAETTESWCTTRPATPCCRPPDMHRPTANPPMAHTHPDRHDASVNRQARSTTEGTL